MNNDIVPNLSLDEFKNYYLENNYNENMFTSDGHINSKYNSVEYDIQILKESDMPNVVNGNLILASHRGNSSVSYFNNLYKLSNGNQVYVYYNNVKYIYEITNMYEVEKTGTITIHRDRDETVIVLITCKKNENKQLVFIGNLVDKEDY